jgi:inward rectifier potassium channel
MIKEGLSNKKKEEAELGFGSKSYSESVRFLNRNGSVNVRRKGAKNQINLDIYHWLVSISWTKFIGLVFASYIVVNTIFAIIYFALGTSKFGGLETVGDSSNFTNLFFFSAQTLTTVGYGHVYPVHPSTNTVSAIESMLGLMGFALVTGLLYGRFSKPKADIAYSEEAVIAPYKEVTGFMFRIANRKQNELIEVECKLGVGYNDPESGKRHFYFLELERNGINFLPLTWTIVHPIDDKSPLFGLSEQQLRKGDVEFVILVKAINDTYFQSVYSRMSYKSTEIVWNAKFIPVPQEPHKDGSISINLKDLNAYQRL